VRSSMVAETHSEDGKPQLGRASNTVSACSNGSGHHNLKYLLLFENIHLFKITFSRERG
jgi:hypothetical protein